MSPFLQDLRALWGDASLWYKIAEINGLTAESALIEGMSLIATESVISQLADLGEFCYDRYRGAE